MTLFDRMDSSRRSMFMERISSRQRGASGKGIERWSGMRSMR